MQDHPTHSVLDLYRRHGPVWAKRRGKALIERVWIDRFCALLPAGSDVLDIGCGSGLPLANELVRRNFRVTGIDGAQQMIDLFQQNVPNASAFVMDMRQLSFEQRFAGQLAWDSFFHLTPEDQRGMFTLFQKHAASHGVLLFTSGPAEGSAIGVMEGEPLYHGSLSPDEYRTLLHGAGFRVMDNVIEDPTCGQRTVWLAQRVD